MTIRTIGSIGCIYSRTFIDRSHIDSVILDLQGHNLEKRCALFQIVALKQPTNKPTEDLVCLPPSAQNPDVGTDLLLSFDVGTNLSFNEKTVVGKN